MMTSKLNILVPAFNEGPRLGEVLETLCAFPGDRRIVVIDDGSRDDTARVAASYPVEVLSHRGNLGKGAALETGIHYCGAAERWLFIDADLIGLQQEHLDALLEPLGQDPDCAMVVGQFRGGTTRVDLAHRFFGILNGQRALAGWFVASLPSLEWTRFGVEVFLSCLARYRRLLVSEPLLLGLSHHTKEAKLGLRSGVFARLQMYRECLGAWRRWPQFVSVTSSPTPVKMRFAVVR